jgi:hypothetical protein
VHICGRLVISCLGFTAVVGCTNEDDSESSGAATASMSSTSDVDPQTSSADDGSMSTDGPASADSSSGEPAGCTAASSLRVESLFSFPESCRDVELAGAGEHALLIRTTGMPGSNLPPATFRQLLDGRGLPSAAESKLAADPPFSPIAAGRGDGTFGLVDFRSDELLFGALASDAESFEWVTATPMAFAAVGYARLLPHGEGWAVLWRREIAEPRPHDVIEIIRLDGDGIAEGDPQQLMEANDTGYSALQFVPSDPGPVAVWTDYLDGWQLHAQQLAADLGFEGGWSVDYGPHLCGSWIEGDSLTLCTWNDLGDDYFERRSVASGRVQTTGWNVDDVDRDLVIALPYADGAAVLTRMGAGLSLSRLDDELQPISSTKVTANAISVEGLVAVRETFGVAWCADDAETLEVARVVCE